VSSIHQLDHNDWRHAPLSYSCLSRVDMPKIFPQCTEQLHLDLDDKTTPIVNESDTTIYPESEVEIHLHSNSSSKAFPIPPNPVLMAVHAGNYRMKSDCNLLQVALSLDLDIYHWLQLYQTRKHCNTSTCISLCSTNHHH
jgi:hypothetical protein